MQKGFDSGSNACENLFGMEFVCLFVICLSVCVCAVQCARIMKYFKYMQARGMMMTFTVIS